MPSDPDQLAALKQAIRRRNAVAEKHRAALIEHQQAEFAHRQLEPIWRQIEQRFDLAQRSHTYAMSELRKAEDLLTELASDQPEP